MSIWFGLFGVPPPPLFSSAAPFEALMMMFFLRFIAPSPVGFGTPTLVGRLVVRVKVDDKEPDDDDDDDDTDAAKVAAHPRILFDAKTTSATTPLFVKGEEKSPKARF